MSRRPGYFKAVRGKTFSVPSDTVLCSSHSPSSKPLRVKREVYVIRGERSSGLDNLNLKNQRGSIIGVFVEGSGCPDEFVPRKRKKTKRRKTAKFSSSFSRYRERNPNFERFGNIPAGAKLGVFKIFQNGQLSSSTQVNTTGSIGGSATIERCWDSLNTGPPYKSGGPLALWKTKIPGAGRVSMGLIKGTEFTPGNWWQYQGDFVDNSDWGPDLVGNYLPAGIPALTGMDTLAWNKTKPRLVQANVAQFVYELRDMPRMLKTSIDDIYSVSRQFGFDFSRDPLSGRFKFADAGRYSELDAVLQPRRLADSFLNHNFGWVPFVSDLVKMYDTWQNTHQLVTDITRNNGMWQRRRASLQNEATYKVIHKAYYPGMEPWGFNIQGLCSDRVIDGISCKGYFEVHEITEVKTWAEGEFTFYRPEFDMNLPQNSDGYSSYIGALQRLATLYGVRISPSLVYKVTPWTWLVDWFTNFGQFVEKLDDFAVDGIVSRGLYIMRHTRRTVRKISQIFFSSGPRTFISERTLEMKQRKVADSPYGFDQTWNNLSLRQLAILGAIGISQSPSGFISRGA